MRPPTLQLSASNRCGALFLSIQPAGKDDGLPSSLVMHAHEPHRCLGSTLALAALGLVDTRCFYSLLHFQPACTSPPFLLHQLLFKSEFSIDRQPRSILSLTNTKLPGLYGPNARVIADGLVHSVLLPVRH